MKSSNSILQSVLHAKISLELTYQVPSPGADLSTAPDEQYSYDFIENTDAALQPKQVLEYAL